MFSANVQCKKIADIMQYFRIEDFFECGVRGGAKPVLQEGC